MPTLSNPTAGSFKATPIAYGRDLSTATAFISVVDGIGYLVTNWHVLAGRNSTSGQIMDQHGATPEQIRVRFIWTAGLGSWLDVTLPLRDDGGTPVWFEHPQSGSRVDVGVLPLGPELQIAMHFPYDPANIRTDIFISVAERLSVIGFPFGVTVEDWPIWTQAFVASEPDLNFEGPPCFLVDARTREGQSGSPVVFYSASGHYPSAVGVTTLGMEKINSRFMGVYSGRINDQSDLGRVWRPHTIVDVVKGGRHATAL